MKKSVCLLGIAFIVFCTLKAHAANKYDIKSSIITLETVLKVGKTEMKMTKIVYFDDFGAKEREETYSNGKLNGVRFTDGKDKISLNLSKKTAAKEGSGDRGLGPRVDIDFFGTTKDIESGLVKKIAPMTLAGQSCDVFEVKKGKTPQTYAAWKKVMVYTKTDSTVIKAVKIEPNAVIPKDKFQVPSGYTLR
ncbi:MAG: hypothetical protein V1874_14745 [Spirochaetota bacterium]